MTDAPERLPLKARVRATYGIDADDPTPHQVTSSPLPARGTVRISINDDPITAEFGRLCLDLGAGKIERPGFMPVGRDYGTEVYPLDYRDGCFDEIVASHVLEHFPHGQVQAVVKDWVRVLKPGGRLKIAVPDFSKIICDYVCEPDRFAVLERCLMGGQIDANDFHKSIFDYDRLRRLMTMAGLVIVGRWESEIFDCARDEVSLNLEGRKP